jgi:hypothetical protein
VGGQLGRPTGARFRAYERLKQYVNAQRGTLFERQWPDLERALDDIYRHPLRQTALDTLSRQLRSGVSDEDLARLVVSMWEDDRLCLVAEDGETQEPRIICSMGLVDRG